MTEQRNPEQEPVAAVCGSEVRVYGPVIPHARFGFRPLWSIKRGFPHHGAARLWAQTYNEQVRAK